VRADDPKVTSDVRERLLKMRAVLLDLASTGNGLEQKEMRPTV
jgi:hypothetical protein